jgi:hypothetical protein
MIQNHQQLKPRREGSYFEGLVAQFRVRRKLNYNKSGRIG